ncbi:MAG TPA: PQQ-binding-like beta-propeller repeat protein [Bryobacteraceae bacterium]|nr:PQQ-binding-like beta-propeller repeat protein [Bryobacteraceae bacterium]
MRYSALLLISLTAYGQAHWPQFRGPGASGLGTGNPPVHWSGETGANVLWKAVIPGLAHSSPIIWGDRIFLTSAVPATGEGALKLGLYGDIKSVEAEGAHTFKVYCLNRSNGQIVWERTAVSRTPRMQRHPKSTHANPTPVTDGKHLVALFGSEGLFAFDLNGTPLWQKDLGALDSGFFMVPSAQWGFASSPILHDGKVIVQADVQKDSFLAAFDVRSGKELWRTPRRDVPTWGTPTIAPYDAPNGPKQQIVVNGWKHIGGYDPRNGSELWRMAGTGDIPVPTPVTAKGLVIFTSAHGPGRPIYAVRTSAAGDVTKSPGMLAWSQDRAGNYMQTPLVLDGLGYFCYDNGVLSVFEVDTGNRMYQQRLGGGNSGFSSSPVAAGGRLYVTNEDGRTYVINAGGSFQLLKENELGEPVMATPAIAEGVLYVRGRRHLFAIGQPAKR